MADFTRRVNDLEAEKRSTLRPYIFVIYMAGIMIVMTTFLMVYFLQQTSLAPGGVATVSVSTGTIDILLVSSLFESWVVGLVAGKMGEGSLSDGFKHSTFLVLISVITMYAASLFIKIPL